MDGSSRRVLIDTEISGRNWITLDLANRFVLHYYYIYLSCYYPINPFTNAAAVLNSIVPNRKFWDEANEYLLWV